MVRNNILKTQPAYGGADPYLTDEERSMLDKTASDPIVCSFLTGIGNCYSVVDTNIVPPLYYQPLTQSVAQLFQQYTPLLQSEVDKYNKNIKLIIKKGEAASSAAAASASAAAAAASDSAAAS